MTKLKFRALPLFFLGSVTLTACSDTGTQLPDQSTGGNAAVAGGGATSVAGGGTDSGGAAAGMATGGTPQGGSSGGQAGATAGGGTGGGTAGSSGGTPPSGISGPAGTIPNDPRDAGLVNPTRDDWEKDLISPTFLKGHHLGQPIVLNGYLGVMGNEEFWFYDISDVKNPKQLSVFNTPNREPMGGPKKEGEAESHTVSMARYGDKFYLVTTGGHGVDTWDVTDQKNVKHLQQIKLEGVAYGDFTAAVWGMYWQGDYIYVGGTDTGLHILDAHDPTNVKFVKRIPTSEFGNVSAGPLDAIGNVLVITTPKENGGIATLDISNPEEPIYLDSIAPSKSYIGMFYRRWVFLQSPVRAWDVLSDPTNIGTADKPVGQITTAGSEYMSFSDDVMFLGHLRPNAGVSKIDLTDITKPVTTGRVWGRLDQGEINDDQFTISLGNLVAMGDDESPYSGMVIGIHAANPDKKPPVVDSVVPKDKSTGANVKSRIGLTFSDNIELTTVNAESFVVRPVGGQPLKGKFGWRMGVLNFDPDEDLQPKTTYEVVLAASGISDLVKNGLAAEFKSTFTTK